MAGIATDKIAGLAIASTAIAGNGSQAQGSTYSFPPGSYSFSPDKPGYWKFVLWGPGGLGGGLYSGASGAYVEYTRYMGPQNTAAVVVARAGAPSTVTFVDGHVLSAGHGSGVTPGVASGGDVNLPGSAGGSAGLGSGGGAAGVVLTSGQPGAGAPGILPFRGGGGGYSTNGAGLSPGGGGGQTGIAEVTAGHGLCLVLFIRP